MKPERDTNNRLDAYRERWWIHAEARPSMRPQLHVTYAIYRYPIQLRNIECLYGLSNDVMPDHQLIVIAREDDYFFGVLHSRSARNLVAADGNMARQRNDPRYTPTTTFETFPFPFVPGKEDFSERGYAAISAAAKALDEERDAWLNPPEGAADLKDRTLTNLYNALQAERGIETRGQIKAAAAAFAPRLNDTASGARWGGGGGLRLGRSDFERRRGDSAQSAGAESGESGALRAKTARVEMSERQRDAPL